MRRSALSFFISINSLFCIEGTSWSELGISQITKPGGGRVGEIQLQEKSTLNLTTTSNPMLNQQYFDGDLLSVTADLYINLNVVGATNEGYTPIYWRKTSDPSTLNAFVCGKMEGNEGACSLFINVDSTLTPLNRIFNLENSTLTLDQNTHLTFTPNGRVRSIFYNKGTLEFDGRFFIDLRDQEGTFTDPKITGKRKVIFEHDGVATKVNTYKKNFDVQIYGDIVSSGQLFELNLLTPNSFFEGHFDIGDPPHYYAKNIIEVANQARAKIDLTFLSSTSPAPQRFNLSLSNQSKAILNATFDRTRYALLDLNVSHSTLYANLTYSQASNNKRGDKDNTRIALYDQGVWITNKSAFADEIFFNVLLPEQEKPVIPNQLSSNSSPLLSLSLTPAPKGGNIDLRYSDFNQTLRTFDRMSEANRITITSKLISGDGGIFKLYGILNRDLWDQDEQGNSIATDQIITQSLQGNHYIQIYWDPNNLDPTLLEEELTQNKIVVAKQLSVDTKGNFIGASAPIGLLEYTTSLKKEEIKGANGAIAGYEWVIGKINDAPPQDPPKPSDAAKALNSIFSIPYKAFISQTQTLHQRLGDLRYIDSIAGSYIRANYSLLHAQKDLNSTQSLSMYTDIMLGGDYGIYHSGGKSFFGASLNIIPMQDFGGDGVYRGDSIAYGFSAYNTTLFHNGIYTDLVLKYFLANHDYMLNSKDFNHAPLTFTSQAILGSFELGYKFRLPIPTSNFEYNFFYLKPQFNLVFGSIFGGDSLSLQHADNYTIQARYSHSLPIQPSFSIDFGKRFDEGQWLGDLFLTLGAQYTFNAGNTLYLQSPFNQVRLEQDDIFNLKLGVSGNIILSSGIRFYFDLSSMFLGRIVPVLNLNAGIRIPLDFSKLTPPSSPASPASPLIYGTKFK